MNLLFYHWTTLPKDRLPATVKENIQTSIVEEISALFSRMFPTENRGFEPLVVLSTQTFQVCTISLSDNSPRRKVQDSNLWRFYPQRLAIFCITTLPTFQGGTNWIWTSDCLRVKQELYRWVIVPIGMVGFEPTIFRLSAECIRPLCYIPLMSCCLFPLPFPNSHPQETGQG